MPPTTIGDTAHDVIDPWSDLELAHTPNLTAWRELYQPTSGYPGHQVPTHVAAALDATWDRATTALTRPGHHPDDEEVARFAVRIVTTSGL